MIGELTANEVELLLASEVIGRIGCHADGLTYVVPVTYAYSEGAVYCHSGDGLKLRLMRKNPDVCFEVEHIDDLAIWRSVIARGRFEELTGRAAADGMRIFVDRMVPLMVSETARPTHGVGSDAQPDARKQAVAYRIVLGEKSGRFEHR